MAENQDAPSDLTSTVVRGASFATVGYVLAQVLNLGFYIALARLLSPADFGEFAAATVLVAVSLMITESGLASAVIQRRDRVDEAASTATVATLISGTLFSILALAGSPLVGDFFDSEHIAALAAASAGTVFLRTSASISDALLQRQFSFLRRLVVEPATVIAFGVAAVIAAANDLGAWSLVIGQYAGYTVDSVLSWLLVRWRPRLRQVSFGMWRELVSYGRHVMVGTAIRHAADPASNAIVARLLGTGALGQFRYAIRLASTPHSLLLSAAAYVLFPAFSRIAEDMDRLRAAFLRSLRWVSVAAFPSGLVFVPLGVPLAVIIFGSQWREAGEALVAMALLPPGAGLAAVVEEALKAIGQPRHVVRINGLITVVTLVAIVALQPFGLAAAAAGLSIGAAVGGLYSLWLMHRVTAVSLRAMLAEVWPPLLAASLAAAGILALEAYVVDAESHGTLGGGLLVVAEALAGAVLYLGLIRALAPEVSATLRQGAGTIMRRVARFRGPDPDAPDPEPLDQTLAP